MRITISRTSPLRRVPRSSRRLALCLAVLLLPWVTSAQAPSDALQSISIADLEDKIGYLASDLFRGRGNGSDELNDAAEYVAGVFRESGLTPIGNNGFFQDFQVNRLSLGPENVLRVVSGAEEIELLPGSDFIPYTVSANAVAEGPLTFVGYGIRAPELDYDDLLGVDLTGRIAVVLESVPRDDVDEFLFNALSDVDYSSTAMKARNVAEAGAIGMLLIQGPLSNNVTSVGYYSRAMRPNLSPRDSVMDLALAPGDPEIPIAILTRNASRRLAPGIRALQTRIDDDLMPAVTELPGTATLRVDMNLDPYTARNVVGLIEGSDPELQDEAIVVGAHYDHDGARGDQIWNGADDNASGTAGLLELAEAFAAGARPRRSVVLAAWAAEEKGMLGSRFYVRNSRIPVDDTVAMFQIDMIGRNEEHGANPKEGFLEERGEDNTNALNMLGSVFSPDLRSAFERANAGVGLELRFRYDYRAQNLIRRSDHWSFLSRGVPAIFLFGGLHPDYHTPNDTADKINYEKVLKVVELVYLTLLEVGGDRAAPVFIDPSQQ